MATKKENRRYLVRKARRILKNVAKDIGNITGNKLNSIGYGTGPNKRSFSENE